MLRKLSMFYDGEIWNTLDQRSAYEIEQSENPTYKEALEAALYGATTVHPLASRFSGKAVDGKVWHVRFKAINASDNPFDNTVKGFAYTQLSGSDKFVRIHFNQQDSNKVLDVINNHYRDGLIRRGTLTL